MRGLLLGLPLLLALPAQAIEPVVAPTPAPTSAPTSTPHLVQKLVSSADMRREWTLSYTLSDRKLSLRCLKSMTGRCGVRLVDAPRVDSQEAELHVEWLAVPAGGAVDRTIQGQAYGLCFRPDVGDDKACEPLSALTAL